MVGLCVVVGYVAATSFASSLVLSSDGTVSGDYYVANVTGTGAQVKVDGVAVPVSNDGIIDTNLLPNGPHRLRVTTTGSEPASTERTISVANPLNSLQQLRNYLYLPLGASQARADGAMAAIIIILVGGVSAVSYTTWRTKAR
jgi:hypothetical protein